MTYSVLWSVYLCAIVVAFLGWYLLFRKVWNTFTLSVSYWLMAVPFLVPFAVPGIESSENWLAPAVIVAVFEAITGNQAHAAAALRPVILVECVALLLFLLTLVVRRRHQRLAN